MAVTGLTSPSVTVNNEPISIVPNSLEFQEGLGEQTTRTQSAGGGSVETVYFDNDESKIGMVKFKIFSSTVAGGTSAPDLVRGWKTNGNANVITISENGGGFERTFNNASLNSNYTISVGSEAEIEVEFMSDQAIQ